MNGRVFVTGFLFAAVGFFVLAALFTLYPPAANSYITLAGALAYLAVAVVVTRRMAR